MTTSSAIDVPVPVDVLQALGRLNGHARAYGCGKRAIYEYKVLASALSIVGGAATVTLRQWTGTCHGCNGTGKYIDSYGERFPHCRACGNSGRVTLRFVEVDIAADDLRQVWHHPFSLSAGWDLAALAEAATWDSQRGVWRDRLGNEPIFWNFANGWSPKQPGVRLEPDALAERMNIVEAWVLTVQPSIKIAAAVDRVPWAIERARREMRRYVLDLGRLPGPCYRCAELADIGLGTCGPPFAFATPACRTHSHCSIAAWPKHLPESTLTPALRVWRDRHLALGFDREDR